MGWACCFRRMVGGARLTGSKKGRDDAKCWEIRSRGCRHALSSANRGKCRQTDGARNSPRRVAIRSRSERSDRGAEAVPIGGRHCAVRRNSITGNLRRRANHALTFPSPVQTSVKQNNTVYCEYYRPTSPGKHPACIVLHILGGDFPLSRTVAQSLADRGVAALFVIMPYYGPRRDPEVPTRMVSADPEETVRGMTQAVKDIRYATAWLAAQKEVDPQQLAITGISLGGIVTALAGAVEPRFQKICPVLAGGGIAKMLWDSTEPHMVAARKRWLAAGKTREGLVTLMETVDPATYGDRIHGRKVLMINAQHDEVIPRVATDALWTAFGQPPIVWYQAGHYTAIWHIGDAMAALGRFSATGQ